MKMTRNTETGEIIVKQSQDHEHEAHEIHRITNSDKEFIKEKMKNNFTPAKIRDSLLVFIIYPRLSK